MTNEELRARLGDDIILGDDGFYVFWPTTTKGAFAPHNLRQIADLLDEMNEPWRKDIEEYFEKAGEV